MKTVNLYQYQHILYYCLVLAVMKEKGKVTEKTLLKIEIREAAERSLRSTIALISMMAVTLFKVKTCPTLTKNVKEATVGAQAMERLVSKANDNLLVHTIHRKNISSTNNNCVYFVESPR